ncbi:toprim domain-containing protein [Acidithiobacillus montserratensis]|uniref:Toprim domain-containing protein n=1 Tax=Acidithiobacillus montserratensis TaxID=2729135 RepID=A0ACD5HBJ7_9PROT|nr:toprim domain-containing protein [Acidithiobacillus montserratensis]MBU2748257.1 hypothetical protein [Acidithiobacillus montserratensis]
MSSHFSVRAALSQANILFSGGQWLRLRGEHDAVSINASSGGWKDHRTGDHGPFRSLGQHLGVDLAAIDPSTTHSDTKSSNEDTRVIQRARNLWSRSVLAIAPKKPRKWAQVAWDAEQQQYADHRDAIYDYLLSRGLDPAPLLPFIRIQTQLQPNPEYVDGQMLLAGADFCFLLPMYAMGKPQIPENICGVQRTYLAHAVDRYTPARKIGRAMLGRKGVTEIRPALGLAPVLLPEHRVLGAGEGFENVASWTQTMHRPGLVCWDWAGLKNWSEHLLPGPDAPTVALLVDWDVSETGQRECAAAVHRIRGHQYGKAVYLLPPDSITPDGKGNRDWNDLLRQAGTEAFAVEIVRAWQLAEVNLALASHPDADTTHYRKPYDLQDADTQQALAEAMDLSFAVDTARTSAREYLVKFQAYQKALIEWQNLSPEVRKSGGYKRPKAPQPLLIKITTGVGKSRILRELAQNPDFADLPLLILTKNHDLAVEYARAGAFHYWGREAPSVAPICGNGYTQKDIANSQFSENTCFRHPVVTLVSRQNHAPAVTACRYCEHGRKFILETYHERSHPYADAKNWFDAQGFSSAAIKDVPACLWLSHQAEASRARVVVAPYQSYSQTLATRQTEDGPASRLVVVDEIPDFTRPLAATSADLGQNAARCADLLETFGRMLAATADPADQADLQEIIADLKIGQSMLMEIGLAMGASVGTAEDQRLGSELIDRIKDWKVKWLPGATARWERADLQYNKEPLVPLRLLAALIASVSTGVYRLVRGVMQVQEITPLGERLLSGKPTLLLDATPSPAVEALVRVKGGQVVAAIARQNVHITHFAQYLHGRSFRNKAHQHSELAALMELNGQMATETGGDPVVLTHLPHNTLAGTSDDPDWGYWGRDEVGHDRWNGRDMLIFGGPLLAPDAQAVAYNGELMLHRLAGDESRPNWSMDVARDQLVVVGSKSVQARAPLPVNQDLREWVLQDYGRRVVQAIGRARGARAEQVINIWIAGGLPLVGLAEHGLAVAEYRQEHQNRNLAKKEKAEHRVQVAIAALQAADQDPSYRAVQKWFAARGMEGVGYVPWKRIQQNVYDLNKDTYEVVDDLLAALDSVERAAKVCGCGLVDIARDRIVEGATLPIPHQIAAELIFEATKPPGIPARSG